VVEGVRTVVYDQVVGGVQDRLAELLCIFLIGFKAPDAIFRDKPVLVDFDAVDCGVGKVLPPDPRESPSLTPISSTEVTESRLPLRS